MKINWERVPRILGPLAVAVFVAVVLMNEFDFSRLWAVPAGLFAAVQLQNLMNSRNEAMAAAMAAAKACDEPEVSDVPATVFVDRTKSNKKKGR